MDDSLVDMSTTCRYVKTIKIACGCYHSVVLSDKNELFTFGKGNHGQLGHGNIFEARIPKQVAGLQHKRVVQIAAGFYHTVVLMDNRAQNAPSTLAVSLGKIINNPTRADIIFIVEGKEYYAHKCIIFARCKPLDEFIKQEGKGIFICCLIY